MSAWASFLSLFLFFSLVQSAALFPAFSHPLRPDFTALLTLYGALSSRAFSRTLWFSALLSALLLVWPWAWTFPLQFALYSGLALLLRTASRKLSPNSYLLDAIYVFWVVFILQMLFLSGALLSFGKPLDLLPLISLTFSHALLTALLAFFLFPFFDRLFSGWSAFSL